ncbi:TetR/AcrR family transcriptional repressor of nem operon [Rhodopirellula rubra]|uniref:TetR/AcrR family transcriptional repressor of nem operon n=1 Tax=Aporhodopirellula rubra TaxID=980271 RepID=A0A7W5E5A3_9BACT|nr:TetR/AcrR family transcriptional regulator [Aporhodopirellula rubra]MBB3210466.1 TetR/AcrR family transcriptional repressor of nem operon [Aporhodopirellula rubra]
MPWEKSFDESDVVEKTMQVFWKKGYAATSISDILDVTGIKRGSLYNAFDGKDDLFMRGLLKYDAEQRRSMMRELESVDDPREAISMFFDFIVRRSNSDSDQKGCFLVNTSLEFSQHSEAVQKVVTDAFKEISAFFEKQIKRGQEGGSIPDTISPRETAKALVASLVGIRVMGRGTFGKAALQQIADQAKRLIA